MIDRPLSDFDYDPPVQDVYEDDTLGPYVKKLIEELGESKDDPMLSDDVFNESRTAHEGSYTKILKAYEDSIQNTLEKKSNYKPKVFWLSFFILVSSYCLVLLLSIALIVAACITGSLFLWSITIIEVLSSFVSTFIVIPKVITSYLFNTEEEKYMSEIIKSIQDYDKDQPVG